MTPEEFDVKSKLLTGLSGNSIVLARLVLVEGIKQTDAAARLGVSRQNASQVLKRVSALLTGYPADWELVELWMPSALAREVRTKAAAEKAKLNSENEP